MHKDSTPSTNIYTLALSIRIPVYILAGFCFTLSFTAMAAASIIGFKLWYILSFLCFGILLVYLFESFRLNISADGIKVYSFLGVFFTEWSNISHLSKGSQGPILVLKEPRNEIPRGIGKLFFKHRARRDVPLFIASGEWETLKDVKKSRLGRELIQYLPAIFSVG